MGSFFSILSYILYSFKAFGSNFLKNYAVGKLRVLRLPTSMVRPLWCGHYGAATMVCTIRCGDSMVLVFYGARQYGAIVRNLFSLFVIFGGPYKGCSLNRVFLMLQITISIQN